MAIGVSIEKKPLFEAEFSKSKEMRSLAVQDAAARNHLEIVQELLASGSISLSAS